MDDPWEPMVPSALVRRPLCEVSEDDCELSVVACVLSEAVWDVMVDPWALINVSS